jgi:hypothetical protein
MARTEDEVDKMVQAYAINRWGVTPWQEGGVGIPPTPVGIPPTPIRLPQTGGGHRDATWHSGLLGGHHGTIDSNIQRANEAFAGIPRINSSTGPGQPGPGGMSSLDAYRAKARELLRKRDESAYTMHSRRDW